ncbi:hypothetical protein MLD38_032229 [Melastoma candidum]|uniref:Uncharacterized protein n=1 Tax=Melastoma candidum TaxID=119954 RepID=A0ACB9M2Y9_9MYRT|nr:hypothetical protein MLD38_032229 [Melastoma candidum]
MGHMEVNPQLLHICQYSSEGFRKVLRRHGLLKLEKIMMVLCRLESKSSKRGNSPGFSAHEKQVWVQKSSSGT